TIFTNNIQVTFLAFGGGILLGIGTLYVLIYNGVLLGAVAGLAIGAGNGRPFFELVVAGLVEGFVTPAGHGLSVALVIGIGLGAIYWGLVWWRGAPPARPVTAARVP
ncbi:MAG TPA: stage II sporulation protein M, partial [Acidimicrobiia bacterium]|nr:stage II sporulation protein M [Acidimicrobiia bacterium]